MYFGIRGAPPLPPAPLGVQAARTRSPPPLFPPLQAAKRHGGVWHRAGAPRASPTETDYFLPPPSLPTPLTHVPNQGGSGPLSFLPPWSPQGEREGRSGVRGDGPCSDPHRPRRCPPLPSACFPPLRRQQEAVLAGDPLVEVDVAQVLGGLLRSTDFLVVVDHPPATGRRGGAQGHCCVARV